MPRRRRALGQHFLSNNIILDKEAAAADCAGKTVLEIGAGDGRLSGRLARGASALYLIEKDHRFAEMLRENFANTNSVAVIEGDFLTLRPFKVGLIVGNVPYGISSDIIFRLIKWDFERAVLMFQKEFAMKLNSSGRDRRAISFFAQHHFEITPLFEARKAMFSPKPKVDSMLVELRPKENTPMLDSGARAAANALFSQKNKSLRSSLSKIAANHGIPKERLLGFCEGPSCSKRVFELENEEIAQLCKSLARIIENEKN